MSPSYPLERDLVAHFSSCLRSGETPWGPVELAFEVDYFGGFSDVLARRTECGELVAFEAKLGRWKEALHQAYRSRCFAQRCYVVLPEATAIIALRHEHEFLRRRVGLCTMSAERGIVVLIDVDPAEPLQPWVATRAMRAFGVEGDQVCRRMRSSSRPPTPSVPLDH